MTSDTHGSYKATGGCHEPQEELAFQLVLEHMPPGGTMLELGAYWSFYSMWFASRVPGARCIMVEPSRRKLNIGKRNFKRNGFKGEFLQRKVGHGHLGVDRLLQKRGITQLDILHADIQGFEFEMLCDADQSLRNGAIGYVFIGTHSQQLHYQCKRYLEERQYITLTHADFDHGTSCCDGILIARHRDRNGLEPLALPLRDSAGQQAAEKELARIDITPAPRRRWGWRRS